MRKIWIVLKSEFLRRVQSKWFILTTLLAPVLFLALMILPTAIGIYASKSGQRTIAVVDETGVMTPALAEASDEQYRFVAADAPVEALREQVKAGDYDGYLVLPADLLAGGGAVSYYSVEGAGLSLRTRLEGTLDRIVEARRLADRNTPPEVLQILESDVDLRLLKLTEDGEAAGNTEFFSVVGFIMGFFIYMAMFIYGAQVMQGVMEEKTSRVVEVVVSSARPFHLLMGKVLGIGAMGLVQMVFWSVLLLGLALFSGTIVASFLDPADFNLPSTASQEAVLEAANFTVPPLSPGIFAWFILFFLGGYLLYASLFAAIGSAVEQQQDAQGLMAPVTMLIIIPIIFITFLVESPNATLSVVLSMIPFFSPILMVVRIAVTEVPFWQVGLAYLLLIGTFVGAVWLSSRIYRVGILMYGKKPSFRDLARWIRYA